MRPFLVEMDRPLFDGNGTLWVKTTRFDVVVIQSEPVAVFTLKAAGPWVWGG